MAINPLQTGHFELLARQDPNPFATGYQLQSDIESNQRMAQQADIQLRALQRQEGHTKEYDALTRKLLGLDGGGGSGAGVGGSVGVAPGSGVGGQNVSAIDGLPLPTDRQLATIDYLSNNYAGMRAQLAMISTEKERYYVKNMAEVYTALQSGNAGVARGMLENWAEAALEGGDQKTYDEIRKVAERVAADPAWAMRNIKTILGFLPSAEGFLKSLDADELQRSRIGLMDAQAAGVRAQTEGQQIDNRFAPERYQTDISGKRSGIRLDDARTRNLNTDTQSKELDMDIKSTLASNPEPQPVRVSPKMEADAGEYIKTAEKARNNSNMLRGVLIRQKEIDPSYGVPGRLYDKVARVFGGSKETDFKNQREGATIDISLDRMAALGGNDSWQELQYLRRDMPDRNDSPENWARYLTRGLNFSEKMEKVSQAYAEWIYAVGNLGAAPRDMWVLGLPIKKGALLGDFIKAIDQIDSGRPNGEPLQFSQTGESSAPATAQTPRKDDYRLQMPGVRMTPRR